MTPANYGSVFSCCLFGSLMMLYLYVFCRSKRFILRNGTFVIYLAVGVVMIRMLLPWNFHFAANVESHKILPFLFDFFKSEDFICGISDNPCDHFLLWQLFKTCFIFL